MFGIRTLKMLFALMTLAVVLTNSVIHAKDSSRLLEEETYTLEKHEDGTIRASVQVNIDWSDRNKRDNYAERKHAEAREIGGVTGNIPIQVTFAHALSVKEIRDLVHQTKFNAAYVTMEARDDNNGLHTIGILADGADVIDLAKLPSGPKEYNLRVVGITVLEGRVPATSLALLTADERVYLPNVTPYVLAEQLAKDNNVPVEQVHVYVPSPHWVLSTER